jgi:hypothetical protein
VNDRELRRALAELAPPDAAAAEERVWRVVRAAFAEREPVPRRDRLPLRAAVALVALGALVGAAVSPPGRAVLGSVREAVGLERAQPALFSLPAEGRLLVTSSSGAWVVSPDGGRRLLGPYREAAWSPYGRFVAAAGGNRLEALEPDGTVRWQLARPDVRLPRWGGTESDTRIAYLSGDRLHLVAGDGTGDVDDRRLPAAAAVAPAWQPGSRHVLAYVTARGRVYVYETAGGSLRWRSRPFARPRQLLWSADGRRLVLVTRDRLAVFAAGRPEPLAVRRLPGVAEAAFAPSGRWIAAVREADVVLLDADRPGARLERAFAGAGGLDGLAWSPDGRWLVVSWPDADQWVFVRVEGPRRLEAVSNVREQLGAGATLRGWARIPD